MKDQLIPGPWFSAPWHRKVWLWARWALPAHLCWPYWMARYLWTYHVTLRDYPAYGGGWKDIDPKAEGLPRSMALPPREIASILWYVREFEMGKYYEVKPDATA